MKRIKYLILSSLIVIIFTGCSGNSNSTNEQTNDYTQYAIKAIREGDKQKCLDILEEGINKTNDNELKNIYYSVTGKSYVKPEESQNTVKQQEPEEPTPPAETIAPIQIPDLPEPQKNIQSYYIFPSDSEYLTYEMLDYLSMEQIGYIRNEIYARHGYIFKKEPYKSYFSSMPWYYPNPNFSENSFNSIEKYNKDLIIEYEKYIGTR